MNTITALNILAALFMIIALLMIIIKTPLKSYCKDYRCLIVLLISLSLFRSVSNCLEWSGISDLLDTTEDHLLVLEIITFGIIFYIIFQKQLISKIQDSETRYRLILENQTDLVVKVDTKGKFIFASPSYCKMYGKTEKELIGRQFHPMIHEEDPENTLSKMERLNKPPYMCTITQRAKTTQGWRWLTWANKAVLDENNQVFAIVGVGRDVTEQIEAEQECKLLLEKVHSKNTEMQSIISVASHDLKSPLVNIMGFNSELAKSCDELAEVLNEHKHPELQEKFDVIQRDIRQAQSFIQNGAEKMQSLVDGLLTISRIGSQEIQIDTIDMNDMVDGILRSMNYQIQENNIEVTVKKLPNCKGDPGQINQVFSNLLDNAIKYRHPDRACRITISGSSVGNHCQYRIADNGIGIQQEHQQKVFEIYHRLDVESNKKGHGLGLTIVTRILERLGGAIQVESEYGQGATFIVQLPADSAKKDSNTPDGTGTPLDDSV